MKLLAALNRMTPYSFLIIGYLLAFSLSVCDYFTGYELSFGIFYLLPICIISWFVSRNAGVVASVVCAVLWLVANYLAGERHSNAFVPFWNAFTRFGFFIIVAICLSQLRDVSDPFDNPVTSSRNKLRKARVFVRELKALTQLLEWRSLRAYVDQEAGARLVTFGINSPPQVVLVLAPHPDDEVFGCGGAIALHRMHGDSVHVIVISDGGKYSGESKEHFIKTRQQESINGLKFLGDADIQFWTLPDGGLQPDENAVALLKKSLLSLAPDRIYVPWLGDNHPDHQATFRMLIDALTQVSTKIHPEIWQYEVWTPVVPNRLVSIGAVLEQKKQAIRAHVSQTASCDYEEGILGLNRYRGVSSAIRFGITEPCEAFFALPSDRFLHFCEKFVA